MQRVGRGHGYTGGYTIVETMIFLAVSGALLVSALAMISGRQDNTAFTTTIHDFQTNLTNYASDVSNGYYQLPDNLSCSVAGTAAHINAATGSQGANTDCIFIGDALQFTNNSSSYVVTPLVGTRSAGGVSGAGDSQSFQQSGIIPATSGANTLVGNGLTVGCVLYSTSVSAVPAASRPCSTAATGITATNTVVFMTTFNSTAAGSTTVGSSQVNLLVTNKAINTLQQNTDSLTSALLSNTPAGGVYICLQNGGGTQQYALASLGGTASQFSVSIPVTKGTCS